MLTITLTANQQYSKLNVRKNPLKLLETAFEIPTKSIRHVCIQRFIVYVMPPLADENRMN